MLLVILVDHLVVLQKWFYKLDHHISDSVVQLKHVQSLNEHFFFILGHYGSGLVQYHVLFFYLLLAFDIAFNGFLGSFDKFCGRRY